MVVKMLVRARTARGKTPANGKKKQKLNSKSKVKSKSKGEGSALPS